MAADSLRIQVAQAIYNAYIQGLGQSQPDLQRQTDFASLNGTQRVIWQQTADAAINLCQQHFQQQGGEQSMTGAGRG